jgi:transposase
MAKASIAMSKLKQILRQRSLGGSLKAIHRHTGVALRTVKKYVRAAEASGLDWEALLELEESDLRARLSGSEISVGHSDSGQGRLAVLEGRFEQMERELRKVGMTRQFLWHRYKQEHPDGYNYSRFCHYFQQWLGRKDVVMHLEHAAGEKVFVDFAGKKLRVVLADIGREVELEVFVGILGGSGYTYVEAVESQAKEDFIGACERMLRFFGGSPKVIVPDNLKSGVTRSNRYEPTLNQAFEDFANHYRMAVIPARAYKPRDKGLVENAVRLTYQRIYALLDEGPYRSLSDLNAAIRSLLEAHNRRPMQGREQSRWDRFLDEERAELSPLPAEGFHIRHQARVTVQKNCHVQLRIDRHYYSVPHGYIGKKVKLCWTQRQVEVYYRGERIAFHLRNTKRHSYTSTPSHLPSNQQAYLDWSPEHFMQRAQGYGQAMEKLFEGIFERRQHPEQAYKSCQGILSLARSYGRERLGKAAERAVAYSCFSYSCVRDILDKGIDLQMDTPRPVSPAPSGSDHQIKDHPNIRGKEYYQ